MTDIRHLQQQIEEAIRLLPIDKQPVELYEPIRYTLDLGGKRMRPVLVLMACELAGGKASAALSPALGIELFHNFTLLHDDIMDQAPLRRGKPTVYQHWNTNIAILSGDVMFVEACKLIAEAPAPVLKPVLDAFYKTAIEVCEGQQWDLNFETMGEVSIDDYLNMIALKTAVLLGASLQIGGLIANGNTAMADQLYELGVALGVAFQLQDDILDTYGDPDKFGKQVGGDIIQNKKTFLLLTALQQADAQQQQTLQHWLTTTAFEPVEKVEAVKAIYGQLDIRQQAEAERDRHYAHAMELLQQLEVPAERKEPLAALATQLLHREN